MHRLRILFLRFYPPPDSFLSILLFRPGPLLEVGCQRDARAGHVEGVARRRADHLRVLRPIDKGVAAFRRRGHRARTAFRKCACAADGAVGGG